MDPNAVYAHIRYLIETAAVPGTSAESVHAIHAEIVESFESLDGWLVMGGALPDEWTRNRDRVND